MAHADQVTDRCTYHGEGAFWDAAESRLRFVDMLAGDVVTLLPTGTVARRHLDDIAAVIRARVDGGYVVATEHGFVLLDEDWQRERTIRAFRATDVRMNEGGVGPDGRLYCGSMAYDARQDGGVLYRLDTDGSVSTALDRVTIPNGMQWSADGTTVFHTDTTAARISVYDFDEAAGTLADPRPFVEFDGSAGAPDGNAIDVEGGLWVAMWGGAAVHRYDATGALSEVIELPTTNITSCAFAGAGSSDLYITTSMDGIDGVAEPAAGAVFLASVGVAGARQLEFAG